MGTINLASYKPVAGTNGDAAQIDNAFDTIQAVINGHIDVGNVDPTTSLAFVSPAWARTVRSTQVSIPRPASTRMFGPC